MGKSQASDNRLKHVPKIAPSSSSSFNENRFACLADEEEIDGRTLLGIPHEMRDRIFDYATQKVIHRTSKGAKMTFFVMTYSPGGFKRRWVRDANVGNLPFMVRQTRSELLDLFNRKKVTHEIQLGFDVDVVGGKFDLDSDSMIEGALPTNARNVAMKILVAHKKNQNPYEHQYGTKMMHSPLFNDFSAKLPQCEFLTHLYLRWDEDAPFEEESDDWGRSGSYDADTNALSGLQQGLVRVIETLPTLLEYSLRFGREHLSMFVSRPATSIQWDSAEVERFSLDRNDFSREEWKTRIGDLRDRWWFGAAPEGKSCWWIWGGPRPGDGVDGAW